MGGMPMKRTGKTVMNRTTGKCGDLANFSLTTDRVEKVLIVNTVTRKMTVSPGTMRKPMIPRRGAKMSLLNQEAKMQKKIKAHGTGTLKIKTI